MTSKGYLFYGTAGVAFLQDTAPTGIFAGNGGNGGNGGTTQPAPGGAGGAGGIATTVGGKQNLTGFVGGLGLEARIGAHATAGIEGLYYMFQNSNNNVVLQTRLSFGL